MSKNQTNLNLQKKFLKKFEMITIRYTKQKPTQMSGFLFIQELFSYQQIRHQKSKREVVSGKTNHAEVCQITYNPEIISLNNILEIFFLVHDPTTLNRQGNDVGRHYRSIILYHNNNELDIIKIEVEKYDKEYFHNKIVTEIQKYTTFYSAEEYHQEYYKNNSEQPYCKIVIEPKLQKARKLLNKYYE